MNFPVDHMYRLVGRGGAGLACDEAGVALGASELARLHLEAAGRRRCEVRPPGEIGRVLKAAYGPQPDAVVQRLHRGLSRTAKWLEAGDLRHAGVEAVMLGFPDLTPAAIRLPLAERQAMIDEALQDRAAAEYKIRKNVRPLQVETLSFVRKTVDRYYAEGEKMYDQGKLNPRLSRQETVGNFVDRFTRRDLKGLFDRLAIRYGPGQRVTINNRDSDTSGPKITFRIPDARVGDLSFDWTLTLKAPKFLQVIGFLNADSNPQPQ